MKVFLNLLLLFAVSADASRSRLSPITRVVELLQQLAGGIEKELKQEEDLYETFVCWGNSVVGQKSQSNSAATARIDELTQYVADLDAGRIELTSERQDLVKELEEINGDIEAAKQLRAHEHEQFVAAEEEMEQAISALDSALEVLKEATEGHEEGELVQMAHHLSEGFAERVAQSALLHRAVELGQRFLSKGDAIFLRRLLTGEVPKPDWKKLNRKATFKMAYKARSFNIQSVLGEIHETFSKNLQDARDKEDDDQHSFDKLISVKEEAKSTAEDALNNMNDENGAKGLSKEEANDEIAALTEQKTNDEGFIVQTKQDLATKKKQWSTRQQLRTGEVAAINKAIAILRSDDNRDLFRKSFSSQSFFLQQRVDKHEATKVKAALLLQKFGFKLLAKNALKSSGHFDEVIESITKMIALLQTQNSADLTNKEECEESRQSDSRDAILAARDIDDKSDKITKLEADIVEIQAAIQEKNDEISKIATEKLEATKIRNRMREDFQASKRDDEQAAQVVQNAKDVLENFYKDAGLNFVQKSHAPTVVAGEAPPPPPATWEAPYGGKKEESTSIVSILQMIKEDIEKDLAKASAEEAADQKEYDDAVVKMDAQTEELNSDIATLEGTQGTKEGDIADLKGERATRKGELDNFMDKMANAQVACDYITINFETRKKNRDTEIDGLIKAQAILEGGAFPTPEDADRDLKPGDAFLQRIKRA